MSVKVIPGNIFTSNCHVLVNTVNCVGVMGAGIALECRLRYPELHEKYSKLCNQNRIHVGMLWIYKAPDRWILNFPTKIHWRNPSRKAYLHAGLKKFCNSYAERNIKSIAFPLLGADKGGIPKEESLDLMRTYLDPLDLDVEIYTYDPMAKDELYDKTRDWVLSQDLDRISSATKISKNLVTKLREGFRRPDIAQLNQLALVDGIGVKTLEKIFKIDHVELSSRERSLFGD